MMAAVQSGVGYSQASGTVRRRWLRVVALPPVTGVRNDFWPRQRLLSALVQNNFRFVPNATIQGTSPKWGDGP